MNRPTLFCLSALNLLFIGILAGEVSLYTQPIAVNAPLMAKKNPSTEQADNALSLDLTEPSEDSYSDLVERPLFIKGRKPVEEPVPEETVIATAQKTETIDWALTGIYRTPKGTTAFFSRSSGHLPKDNFRKCQQGDALDGWQLSEINESGVNLTLGTQTKYLPLHKPKPKNATPPPVAPANPLPTPAPQSVDAKNLTIQPTATADMQPPSPDTEEVTDQ